MKSFTYSYVHHDRPAVFDLEGMMECSRLALAVIVTVSQIRKLAKIFSFRQLLAVVCKLFNRFPAVPDFFHELLFGVFTDVTRQSPTTQHRDSVLARDLEELFLVNR